MKPHDIIARISGQAHKGGTFSKAILERIADHLPARIECSIETGCGASSILLSNLSKKHYIFAYDDRSDPLSSVNFATENDCFKKESVEFVFGPTQNTLLQYTFPPDVMFDVMLLDGPHGYPFPDLEYAILYEKLKSDGILIIDDIHIASIGNLFDVLREDRMYDEVGVVGTTGILRRTNALAVPATGDHWYEQGYNISRFPVSMEKYNIDRTIPVDVALNMAIPPILEKYMVNGGEYNAGGDGIVTTDLRSQFDFHFPDFNGEKIRIECSYRSIAEDSSKKANMIAGDYKIPIDFAPQGGEIVFVSHLTHDKRLSLVLEHPFAQTEHQLQHTPDDFRRLGTVIKLVRFSSPSSKLPPLHSTDTRISSRKFSEIALQESLSNAIYKLGTNNLNPRVLSLSSQRLRKRPRLHWHFCELFAIDSNDYVNDVAMLLSGRPATEVQLRLMERNRPWDKIEFLLLLDAQNRERGHSVRVIGLQLARFLLRLRHWSENLSWGAPRRVSQSIFKRYCLHLIEKNYTQIALYQNFEQLYRDIDERILCLER